MMNFITLTVDIGHTIDYMLFLFDIFKNIPTKIKKMH